MNCADNEESEKTKTQQRNIIQKKPAQMPVSSGALFLKPQRIPALNAKILLGPGVNAVIIVNTKKADMTENDIILSS